MAMKLDNGTNWDTNQFKAFIRAVAEKEALTPEDIGKLKVTLEYGRHSSCRGDTEVRAWGYYNQWKFRLACVKDAPLSKMYLARTIAIMLNYNQGVWSVRNNPSFYGPTWRDHWTWAEQFPLEMKKEELEVKPGKPYKLALKMEHCLKQIVVWEKRQKLAETKLKTWRKKLRYYELNLIKSAPSAQVKEEDGQ